MIIDYTDYLQKENSNIILTQGKEKNILILGQDDGQYWLEYRWLSVPCRHSQDEAVVCVQGTDVIYLEKEDIKEILHKLANNQPVNLFDYFNLF